MHGRRVSAHNRVEIKNQARSIEPTTQINLFDFSEGRRFVELELDPLNVVHSADNLPELAFLSSGVTQNRPMKVT
jgi:hypothetical protein